MADLNAINVRIETISGRRVLVTCDVHGDEWLATMKDQKEFLIEARTVRNAAQHRYLFALLRAVREASDHWPNEEALLTELKFATNLSSRSASVLVDNSMPPYIATLLATLRELAEDYDKWGIGFANKAIHGAIFLITKLWEKNREFVHVGSIAFASMSQDQFNSWFTSANRVLAQYLGCSPDELLKQVEATAGKIKSAEAV